MTSNLKISIEQITLAWRKAKIDLYYSTNPPLLDMANYEDNLSENLNRLLQRLNGPDETWLMDRDFLGSWTLTPKAIELSQKKESKEDTALVFADPDEEWSKLLKSNKATAQFRVMARCSMDFHVLSTLWMSEVGHLFDEKLSLNVYGSRIRRNRYDKVNPLAMGSFKPYLRPFKEWRDGAIKAMSAALNEDKKVIALTADVSSFYHELNPDFMLDITYHTLADLSLNPEQSRINSLFIKALQAWAKETPLKKGLPVGLPASAVVANAALIQLDQFIEQQVIPLHYGRYVDDLLLVMENTNNISNVQDFWNWIFHREGGHKLLKKEEEEGSILFTPDYLKNSRVEFKNQKNKLFVISGSSGKAMVNAIKEQINLRASEWRALPTLPENPDTIATDLLKATNHAGEQADNLRKTDALTLHRAGFALNLRDYEAYERDLPPKAWVSHRHAFFDAVIEHLLTPRKFFELSQYLPRIIRMATACEDFQKLGTILGQLNKLEANIRDECDHTIKASNYNPAEVKKELNRWHHSLKVSIAESIVSALPPKLSRSGKTDWKLFIADIWLDHSDLIWLYQGGNLMLPQNLPDLHKLHARLFSHDLAHIPLRFCGLPRELVSQRGIPDRSKLIPANWQAIKYADIESATQTLNNWFRPKLSKGIPPGLYFATRPFSLNELYLIAQSPFDPSKQGELGKVVLALRGFELNQHNMPHWDKHQRTLTIPNGESKSKQTIAVSSWETSDTSFVAAALRLADPSSRSRYQRLNRLVNELISRPDQAGYLVFPELAIPPQWFMRLADKLKGRAISLIAGVEYLHAPKKRATNQIWASLTHDGLGFPSLMLYRQDKQTAAIHEEQELYRISGLHLQPSTTWHQPPIIQHGDFHFAMLICSELTNIRYRTDLRGKIDALFVPEWNSDTDTFNSLVESAALDIHAYIIQCNNRLYGDSRIRAPYKDRWKRDILRVKGGNHDYCITGEIDVLALRQFQSSYRSPSKEFKPVPDGFDKDMEHARRVLPKGDSK